jgi:sporulation protein YlmC with PRC-barrel domain
MQSYVLSSTTLVGNDVRNTAGQDIGTIKDLMIDTESGNIIYAVLSFGGFLGIGDKLFAVPYSLLRLDTTNECYVLNIEKEILEDAPGFDNDEWPEHADYDFVNEVYSYYGYDPYYGTTREVKTRVPAAHPGS